MSEESEDFFYICNMEGEEGSKFVSYCEKLAQSLRKLEGCSLGNLCVCFLLGENDGVLEDVSFPAFNSIKKIIVEGEQICRFTKWLVSLANLQKLLLKVKDIQQQDLEMVGRLPALLELCLTLCGNREESIIITGGGFQQLRSFRFSLQPKFVPIILPDGGCTQVRRVCPKVKGLLFEAGAMPKLKALSMCYPLKYSPGCSELGIEHLSSLASLRVRIDLSGMRDEDVQAAWEAAVTHTPTIQLH